MKSSLVRKARDLAPLSFVLAVVVLVTAGLLAHGPAASAAEPAAAGAKPASDAKPTAEAVAEAESATAVDAPAEESITIEVGGLVGWQQFGTSTSLGRLTTDSGSAIAPSLRFGGRVAAMLTLHWLVEVELDVATTEMQNNRSSIVVVGLRPHAIWDITTSRLRPFALMGLAGLLSSPSNPLVAKTDMQVALEAGGGLKFDLEDWYGLRVDARAQVQSGSGDALVGVEWAATLGMYGRFPTPRKEAELAMTKVPDSDNDGLVDDLDRCPDKPGTLELRGCPPSDRDGDGIADEADQCPRAAGPAETKGCPPGDRDGDGVKDNEDKCPEVKGAAGNSGCAWPDGDGDGTRDTEDLCPAEAGLRRFKGCPDRDGDKDGLRDFEDKCPAQPGTKEYAGCPVADSDGDGVPNSTDKCPAVKGVAEAAGCPDPDSDKDGVADRFDKCPDKPAGKGGKEGCPADVADELRTFFGTIRSIDFEPGSAVLSASSRPALIKAAGLIRKYPGFKVEVSGHTDNTGNPALNTRISQQRADAVVRFLIGRGVPARRLKALGLGPDRPIADNETAEGRKANRRVDFKLLSE